MLTRHQELGYVLSISTHLILPTTLGDKVLFLSLFTVEKIVAAVKEAAQGHTTRSAGLEFQC